MAINKPTKPKTFSTGLAYAADVNEDFDVIYAKVDELIDSANNAAGSTPSTAARLSVSMNADGTMKTGITAGGEWINSAFTLLYVSTTSFTADGDRTAIFTALRRIKATLAASTVYSQVVSSTYSGVSGLTTVTIADAVLTNPITSIEHSTISPLDANGSVTPAMLGAVTTATANKLALRDANGKLAGDILGNAATAATAATATALKTARTIGGVSFDGTANINLPGVNIAGNQSTTGNAATVTTLTTAQVLAATAGGIYNGVGTYVFGYRAAAGFGEGELFAGSSIHPSGFISGAGGSIGPDLSQAANLTRGANTLGGTWQTMGRSADNSGTSAARATLFLRIA